MRYLLSLLFWYVGWIALIVLAYAAYEENGELAAKTLPVSLGCLVGLWFSGRKARADKRRHEAAERAKDDYWLSKGRK